MAGLNLDAGIRGRGSASFTGGGGSAMNPPMATAGTYPAGGTMGVSGTGSQANRKSVAGHGAIGVGMVSVAALVFIYFSLPKG
jgi:hypothetical protein